MRVIVLSRRQIKEICRKRMIKDFPVLERKPLSMIMKELDRGRYVCLGMIDETKEIRDDATMILGYAFFVKNGNDYLFDYLATDKNMRNQGLGSQFLALIAEYFKSANSVIGEVENPVYAVDGSSRGLQTRRKNFYLRNGYVETKVTARVFDVQYEIIELVLDKPHSEELVKNLYLSHYQAILPRKLYQKMIKIN